jgi:hypothetical protein
VRRKKFGRTPNRAETSDSNLACIPFSFRADNESCNDFSYRNSRRQFTARADLSARCQRRLHQPALVNVESGGPLERNGPLRLSVRQGQPCVGQMLERVGEGGFQSDSGEPRKNPSISSSALRVGLVVSFQNGCTAKSFLLCNFIHFIRVLFCVPVWQLLQVQVPATKRQKPVDWLRMESLFPDFPKSAGT